MKYDAILFDVQYILWHLKLKSSLKESVWMWFLDVRKCFLFTAEVCEKLRIASSKLWSFIFIHSFIWKVGSAN